MANNRARAPFGPESLGHPEAGLPAYGRDTGAQVTTRNDIAQVALCVDDGYDFCTKGTSYDSGTFQTYMSKIGHPWTQTVETQNIGSDDNNYLTAAELTTLANTYGVEIASQFVNGNDTPTLSSALNGIKSSKTYLESLIRQSVDTFVCPSVFDNLAATRLRDWADLDGPIMESIRDHYVCSRGFNPGRGRHCAYPIRFTGTTSVSDLVEECATPGKQTIIYFHNDSDTLSEPNATEVKSLVDTLVAARNAGNLSLVTLRTLLTTECRPLLDSTGALCQPSPIHFPNGDFESGADESTPTLWGSGGAAGYTFQIDDTEGHFNGGSQGAALFVPDVDNTWAQCYPDAAVCHQLLRPNRNYVIRIWAKGSQGELDTPSSVSINPTIWAYYRGESDPKYQISLGARSITDAGGYYYWLFSAPKDMTRAVPLFVGNTRNTTCYLDDICAFEV